MLIMIISVDSVIYWIYRRDMEKNTASSLKSGVTVLSEYIQKSIENFNTVNISKIRSSRIMDYSRNMTETTEFVVRRKIRIFAGISSVNDIDVSEVYIRDNAGNEIYWDEDEDIADNDYKVKDFHNYIEKNEKQIFKRFGASVWRYFSDSPDKIYVMTDVRNENDLSHEGLVCIAIDRHYLENMTKNFDGNKVLYDECGNLLYYDEEVSGLFEIKDTALDNEDYIISDHDVDKLKWTVRGIISRDEELNSAKKLVRTVLLTEIAAFSCVMIIMFFVMGNITYNIKLLVESFRRIDSGENPDRISYKSGNEIAYVCEEFNQMITKLKRNAEDLALNNTLRERAEYNALIAQMNPHFLYNVLESIQSMALLNSQNEIVEVIQKLSSLLRVSLSGNSVEIRLEEELNYVRQYIDLQNLITSKRYSYDISADDDSLSCPVPKLILQPIIENSIKHGFRDILNDAVIVITAFIRQDELHIIICDNGTGMEQSLADKLLAEEEPYEIKRDRAHIGIKSIQKRISMLYGDSYGMKIETGISEGMTVKIVLPSGKEGS
ncbi:MAG: histidine kinase [Lachnospiraceae bacterium]|nr:histidine kinase [Lachnospiraceae bacterium]